MREELSKSSRDQILRRLNEERLPFPRFAFAREEEGTGMRELGRGSFGITYVGEGRDSLSGLTRAVKVLGFQQEIDPAEIPKIKREIELQIRLFSRCGRYIVNIFDAGSLYVRLDEDGSLLKIVDPAGADIEWKEDYRYLQFISMEKLEPVLRGHSQDPQLTIDALRSSDEDEVIKFALHIGSALEAAHQENILHRDIKLENIFYSESTDSYKLGDFGLAKLAEGGTTKSRVGTGPYQAPEVDNVHRYDQRADIYSFGITLYRLLNELNFPGSGPLKFSRDVKYNRDSPLPEPAHGSDSLKRIVSRACSFRPEERYQTMTELLDALRTVDATSRPEPEEILISRYEASEKKAEPEETLSVGTGGAEEEGREQELLKHLQTYEQ